MQIIEEIDKNDISLKLKQARQIKEWVEKSESKKRPSKYSEDETEAYLGEKYSVLKYNLIDPYLRLTTEKEREEYIRMHPNLEEIMEIVYDINSTSKDKRDIRFTEKMKKVMKKMVFENVSTNQETREELHQLTQEFEQTENIKE